MNCLVNATSGSFNAGVGYICLRNVTTGSQNSAVGCNCLPNLTTGIRNIAMGETCGTSLVTGSNNIYLVTGQIVHQLHLILLLLDLGATVSTDNAVQIGNTSNDQFTLGNASASVLNCGSIVLASSGATGTKSLNYYEEFTHSFVFTGLGFDTIPMVFRFVRCGKIVTMTGANSSTTQTATSSGYLTSTVATYLPTRFRPSTDTSGYTTTQINGTNTMTNFNLQTNGLVLVHGSGYTSGQTIIVGAWSFSYVI